MRIEPDLKLDYDSVLLRPKRSTLSSRSEVDLFRTHRWLHSSAPPFEGIPIVAANMDGVGTMQMADALSADHCMTALLKSYEARMLLDHFDCIDRWVTSIQLRRPAYHIFTVGVSDDDLQKTLWCVEQTNAIRHILLDVANGYSQRVVDVTARYRCLFPHAVIWVGNVCTPDQTQELLLAGADVVKIGIGPGSVCTTRIKTGVGYPQLSAVMECADAAHGLGGLICADGGCRSAGDVAKAFAAGADFVMLGGMLAGCDEGGGDVITRRYLSTEIGEDDAPIIESKSFVKFYGMSSKAANDKHSGGLKHYRTSEGREVLTPYRGPVTSQIQDILGGLRSTCTYVGARNLKALSRCATFVRCEDTHNRRYE